MEFDIAQPLQCEQDAVDGAFDHLGTSGQGCERQLAFPSKILQNVHRTFDHRDAIIRRHSSTAALSLQN